MERPAVADRLTRMGRRRTVAREMLAEISEEMPALVREALARGHSKAEVARMAQISRVALDSMLKQNAGRDG